MVVSGESEVVVDVEGVRAARLRMDKLWQMG
jgi:hypothetical protein